MPHITRVAKNERQREIVKLFNDLQGKHSLWKLWSDSMAMIACAISNTVDVSHREQREQMYMTISSAYSKRELDTIASIFAMITLAFDDNPDQDLLGELYMALGLGNDHNGQFFTPYDVCRCMAEMSWGDQKAKIETQGWISVNDPAVGAGALLIAFANTCRREEVNFQQNVLFVAQDIDFTTACMCYIQISLLGCPGYVYVGNTLTDPCTAVDKRGLIPAKPENCWFMPMYFTHPWAVRCALAQMELLMPRIESKTVENDSIAPQVPADENKESNNKTEHFDNEIELLTNENGQLMLF